MNELCKKCINWKNQKCQRYGWIEKPKKFLCLIGHGNKKKRVISHEKALSSQKPNVQDLRGCHEKDRQGQGQRMPF